MKPNEKADLKVGRAVVCAPTQFSNRSIGVRGLSRRSQTKGGVAPPAVPSSRQCGPPAWSPPLLLLLAVAAPLLAGAQQSGVRVEEFAWVLGAEPGAITVAPNGTIYSAGDGFNDPTYTYRGLIISSANGGNTWTAPSFVDSVPGYDVSYGGIAADSAGNLYIAGWTDDYNITTPAQWLVKRSSDGGSTWTTVDDYVPGTSGAEGAQVAVDASGNVFVTGFTYDNGVSWVIRRGIGGANFTTVDSVAGYYVNGIFGAPSGIFAVGISANAWIVRRSSDGGNTWSTVDTFLYSSGHNSEARGGGVDSLGNIYVIGLGSVSAGRVRGRTVTIGHWLVRKSSNGGNTWITDDDFASSTGSSSAAAFAAASNGDLFVAGTSSSPCNTGAGGYWTVRKKHGGTGTWSTVDITSYEGANPYAMAANATGNVFVTGPGGVNGQSHWLIKRY